MVAREGGIVVHVCWRRSEEGMEIWAGREEEKKDLRDEDERVDLAIFTYSHAYPARGDPAAKPYHAYHPDR